MCVGIRLALREKAPNTMTKYYPEFTKRISDDIKKLRKDVPDTLSGFSALANAASRGGALDKKTKDSLRLPLALRPIATAVSASMPKHR